MNLILSVVALLVLLPGILAAAHLLLLSIASLRYQEPVPGGGVPRMSFLVLIPAHNEEAVIEATLASVGRSLRAGDRVVVVADNCSDRTAAVARAAGAEVLERTGDPGRSEARQAGLDHAAYLDWDAVLMADADSVLSDGFLDACERALASGADALQARSEAMPGPSIVDQAVRAAFSLQGVTIPRGRDRLGVSVRLRGTGMVLRRDVMERVRFRAPASEDLWLTLDLLLLGVLPRHMEAARLTSENAPNWRAASAQKQRYEAGRMTAAREFLGPLLRRHTAASLDAACFLATPPFAVAVASLLLGGTIAALGSAMGLVVAAVAALGALALVLVIGLLQARAPARTWLAVVVAPWYVLWKLVVQVRAVGGLLRSGTTYGATERRPASTVGPTGRAS